MTYTIRTVLIQALVAAVFMLLVAAVTLITATYGVDPKDFPPVYAETKTAAEGRRVFQTSGCSSCHQIMRQGGNGPDLTYIGRKYDQQTIADLVRRPRDYLASGPSDLMPAISKHDLSDARLKKLSRYLATLK